MTTQTPTVEQSIVRLARDMKSPRNKAYALQSLQNVIASLDWDSLDDNGQSLQDLARLYAHFLPPMSSKVKTDFDWCARAIGKNDKRYYLNWVYVDEKFIRGTDGHSLHLAFNQFGLDPGYYDTAGNLAYPPSWAKYPDTQRIRPNPEAPCRQWLSLAKRDMELVTKPSQNGKTFSHYELAIPDTGNSVHIASHLIDRLYSMEPDAALDFNIGDMGDTVLVALPEREAVLMPLRQ